MAKQPPERRNQAGNTPRAPEPSATNAFDGMAIAREEAGQFMPDNVRFWAGVAHSPSSQASLWTKVQCTRLLAEVAGAISRPPTPLLPLPSSDEGGGQSREPN
jgi:hypothetical protein